MTSTGSWRLKITRAQVHLNELRELLLPFGEVHDYRIAESVEEEGIFSYHAWSRVTPNPVLAVVLGDLLFNVRSALDHLAVELVPDERKDTASFPILALDPDLIHAGDEKGDASRRQIWKRATTGMSSAAVAVIRSVQPFSIAHAPELSYVTLVPEDAVLDVLSRFQNADKHRNLIAAAHTLNPTAVSVRNLRTGELTPIPLARLLPNQSLQNGAVFFRSRTEVQVQAEGTTEVAAGVCDNNGGSYRRLPDFPVELLRTVSDIADRLEACM